MKCPSEMCTTLDGVEEPGLPSGSLTKLLKITSFTVNSHYKSPFSIAMFVITGGYLSYRSMANELKTSPSDE